VHLSPLRGAVRRRGRGRRARRGHGGAGRAARPAGRIGARPRPRRVPPRQGLRRRDRARGAGRPRRPRCRPGRADRGLRAGAAAAPDRAVGSRRRARDVPPRGGGAATDIRRPPAGRGTGSRGRGAAGAGSLGGTAVRRRGGGRVREGRRAGRRGRRRVRRPPRARRPAAPGGPGRRRHPRVRGGAARHGGRPGGDDDRAPLAGLPLVVPAGRRPGQRRLRGAGQRRRHPRRAGRGPAAAAARGRTAGPARAPAAALDRAAAAAGRPGAAHRRRRGADQPAHRRGHLLRGALRRAGRSGGTPRPGCRGRLPRRAGRPARTHAAAPHRRLAALPAAVVRLGLADGRLTARTLGAAVRHWGRRAAD
jgi:hypothetical protein